MDLEIGKGVVNVGKDYVNKGFENVNFRTIKPYFDINNEYIIKKIMLIICPFRTKNWNSKLTNPDLYIPLMSFLTYILITGFFLGLKHEFTPEKLSIVFTKLLTYEAILGMIVKMVGYFMDITELGFFDFICYSGYKFVVVLFLMMVNVRYVKILWRLYLFIAFFFFLSRSMKAKMNMTKGRRRKIYFLFIVVILEMFLVFVLAR